MIRQGVYLLVATLMLLLVSLLASAMSGSIRTTHAGHVGGNAASELSPAQPAPTTAVSLTEYQIEMPTSLPAGVHVFDVANNGNGEHNFTVEGQGIMTEFVTDLTSGQTQSMQIYLAAGTYTVYCPIGDHRTQGMETSLTVTPP
jgi:uncharacterized cupredoxin-like copper-binding protein